MRDQRDARRQQFGARGFDLHRPAVGAIEPQPVIRTLALAIFELGLGDGRPKIHVPQRRRFELIRKPLLEQVQKADLRDTLRALVDRRVGHRPVDRQTEISPQMLERFFVFLRQPLAELDEIGPRDREGLFGGLRRRLKGRIVGQRWIAAHAVIVLNPSLSGKAVVVPPHRVEHFSATHPLESRNDVGMRVREDMTDMQRSADGRRRRVDRIDVIARFGAVEAERAVCVPPRLPFRLEPLERRLFRNARRIAVSSIAHNGTASLFLSGLDSGLGIQGPTRPSLNS